MCVGRPLTFKTDLDRERLPSATFATNQLILSLAALTYNVLRLLGQQTLTGPDAPICHSAKRRRIKTVMYAARSSSPVPA